jgi:beta-lactamase class A
MRLALEAKRSETYRGRAVEEQAVQFLERSGFKVEHQRAAKCPFDIMVNGSVRVDVKAARLNSAGKYTFGTKKPRPTCDVYMLGEDNIQAYAYQIGMGSTNMIDNDTSARDIGKFFQMLYQNKITSKALTSEMLEYLENTEFEDRIVPLLPKNVHVYHKTGDGVNFIHDGGIISNGKTPFILVVMSSNITDEKLTKATISKIAQIVFLGRGQK